MIGRLIYSTRLGYDGQRWIVLVVNRFTRTVVTCGIFHFRNSALRWADDAIARRAWRDGSELPDDWEAR